MEAVHSAPGAYIPVPSCSAGILKGFPTFIRGAEGISHQRWRYLGFGAKLKLGYGAWRKTW